MRVKVTISYDGTEFYGSQEQKDRKTVVGVLHSAFKKINISKPAIMSGRTDRGVHSTGQVFHLDIPDYWKIETFLYALKRAIPKTISIRDIKEVDNNFHSRFSAKRRVYRYIFSTSSRNPFEEKFVTFIERERFDFSKIQNSISLFKGVHNFHNFRKVGSENSSDFREIFKTQTYKFGRYYILRFEANSFLRSQVRLMVGALLSIGYGKLSKKNLSDMIDGEKRVLQKIAPPNGLYLTKVIY